jgi:isocitrate dehydrogenase (NAD+)
MNLSEYADKIEKACFKVLKEKKYTTRDLGGKSTTKEYTRAIIGNL